MVFQTSHISGAQEAHWLVATAQHRLRGGEVIFCHLSFQILQRLLPNIFALVPPKEFQKSICPSTFYRWSLFFLFRWKLPPFYLWIIKNARVPEKHLFLLYCLRRRFWLCGSQQTVKFLKRWEYQTTLPASWEICMEVKKQQLEPDMEQQIGSKLGKEYVKAIYCHPAYLTYIQSTSCKMLG